MRDSFLRGCVGLGAATAFITEALSPFHLLHRTPLAAAWLVAIAAAIFWRRLWLPPRKQTVRPLDPLVAGIVTAVAAIIAVVALTAVLSPPNSTDAMAYHLPRVVYWAQSASVAFFPTPYFNQISLQPLMEYGALQTYVLSGGDRFVNLLTCAAFLASVTGISALAGALGLSTRGQALAALLCATLPNGILQASGAKNEWLLALWLICAAYFAARENAPFTGISLGLALAAKATAYLFAPPLLLAILLIRRGRIQWRWLAWSAAGVVLINGPQYLRNLQLSGSPLGFDSAQGDGRYRWRNEPPSLKATLSNWIRHTSEQLGDRSPERNAEVFHAALALHRALGIDPQDPATTWPGAQFSPPLNANHEANANNRWHLLLLATAVLTALAARRRVMLLYAAGLFAGFLLFCFYLKWQPFEARLELPLFALASPVTAGFLDALRRPIVPLLVCLFLVNAARPALFQNWTRPLKGPGSLFATSRDFDYFRDMTHFENRDSYLSAVRLTAQSGCRDVGIDINQNQLEYPFQALLRERASAVRFFHTGVENASARYTPGNRPLPCAVLCLDCAGNAKRIALYESVGPPVTIGRFLLFLSPGRAILPEK